MKKLVSVVLAFVLCLMLAPCAFAAGVGGFVDVPSDAWYALRKFD